MGKKVVSIILTICILLSSNIFNINTNAEEKSELIGIVSEVTSEDLVTLKKDKIYEIENNVFETLTLVTHYNEKSSIDYKIYYNSKRIDKLDYDGDLADVRLSKGEKVAIGVRNEDTEVYIPKEIQGTLKEINEPVCQSIILEKGKTLQYSAGEERIAFDTSASKDNNLRYVSKSEEFVEPGFGYYYLYNRVKGTMLFSQQIEEYQVMVGDEIEFYIPYGYKDRYKIINKKIIEEMDIEGDTYYEVIHNGDIEYNTEFYLDRADDETTNYIAANCNNVWKFDIRYNDYKNIIVGYRSAIRFKVNSNETRKLYMPYEFKNTVKKAEKSYIDEFIINRDNPQCIVENQFLDRKIYIFSDKEGSEGSAVITYEDGDISNPISIKDGDYFTINKGDSIKFIADSDSEFKIYTPNDEAYNEFEVEDFNMDKKIDVVDLSIIAKEYNKKSPYFDKDNINIELKEFRYDLDLNEDNIIDLYDLVNVSKKM